ncbi:MAG: CPBP family intramembrane glutamic endopeptidase [Thermomonas sp.]
MNIPAARKSWTLVGLLIALLGIPLIATTFRLTLAPLSTDLTVAREVAIFAGAALLLCLVRRGESLPWSSVGLRRMPLAPGVIAVVLGLIASAVAIALGLLLIQVSGIPFGHATPPHKLPLLVTCLVVLRAGIVEELTFRGYAIERLEALTGKRWLAVGLPLIFFAAFHSSQGAGGMLLALLGGGVLSALYLWKRNLWVNMGVHFLVDFIPNVLLANMLS